MTKPMNARDLVRVAETKPPAAQMPDAIISALGPPFLIAGEDPESYDLFYACIRSAVEPADAVEELWCNDVAVLAWEARRYRRHKASLLRSLAQTGLKAALSLVLDSAEARKLTKEWVACQPEAIERVEHLLGSLGSANDVIAAHTLAVNIRLFRPIDELAVQAEVRRDAALRELDRRRGALAHRMRRAIDNVEDAHFEDVSGPEFAATTTGAIK